MLAATITFVLAGTFSPGPNTIMSGTLGMMHGYRRALPFMLGIFTGFVIVMLLCAAAATAFLELLPDVEGVLRYAGAAWILWLAWSVWTRRQSLGAAAADELPRSQGYPAGFALQFVNPKVAVYGLIIFTTFLADLTDRPLLVALAAVGLAVVSFSAISAWALLGSAIRQSLCSERSRAIAAAILALSLAYTAVELVRLPFESLS